jgi:Concanavalin A-like lectin/glucanases superfamily
MPRKCGRSNRVTDISAVVTVTAIVGCSPTQYYIETGTSGDGGQTGGSTVGTTGTIHVGGSEQRNSTATETSSSGNAGAGGYLSSTDSPLGGVSSIPVATSIGGASPLPYNSSTGGSTLSNSTGGRSSSTTTGGSGLGGAKATTLLSDSNLVLRYKFDETKGASLLDASGNGRNGKIVTTGTGAPSFSNESLVGSGALFLDGKNSNDGGYVEVPMSLLAMGATTDVTFSCWVYVKVAQAWQRVFEFGSSSSDLYLFLTVQQTASVPNSPRFAITTSGITTEQRIDMTTPASLSTNKWHHLVVVLGSGSPYTGTLYIDNEVVGINSNMTLRPSNLKYTSNNWLGRSEYPADSLYNGLLDDFRVYARALSIMEIAALYAER